MLSAYAVAPRKFRWVSAEAIIPFSTNLPRVSIPLQQHAFDPFTPYLCNSISLYETAF
jgi:hypothetical protein